MFESDFEKEVKRIEKKNDGNLIGQRHFRR